MQKGTFARFVVPSIGAMLVTGLYFVVDGIFVGRGVGTDALAAINLSVPFISILTSVSMMITLGGATLTAISFGRGDPAGANRYFRLSMALVLGFSLLMTIISVLFSRPLARLLGANDALLEPTADYLLYFVLFGVFLCGAAALSAFVRNDNNPRLAFWGMMVGALTNVFLDWLFIFPLDLGIIGAAVASGLGQVLACATLSLHFLRKKGQLSFALPRPDGRAVLQILRVGAPEFLTQMSQPVTILVYNWIVLELYGQIGVAAYSVISYLLLVVLNVFLGLAQGMQPLLSRSFGAGDLEGQRRVFRKGLVLGLVLAVGMYGVLAVWGRQIIAVFNPDPTLVEVAYECIRIYGLSFILAAANIVYTISFLATRQTATALVLAVLRSFVLNSLLIPLLPAIWGKPAVWLGLVVAEALVLALAVTLKIRRTRTAG